MGLLRAADAADRALADEDGAGTATCA